ncbi:hypothetical protein Tco_0006430 [Tanacetum coccineum]
MTPLADKAIISGVDNRPPMMEKDMYDSWKSIMELYMMNRQHGRMILESVENGPLIWPSIEENRVTRPKKYSELSATEAIQADCDIKATNIILQGLPPEVYALERECKLYDEFDKFAYKKRETLRDFYLRFSLLLNDMNIYNMKMEQFQVNIKFLNTLPPEWSKFVTDVKLVQDLHTTNIDQLHAYLGQHEFHANEVHLMHERNSDPLALYSTHQSSTPLSITYPSNDYQSSVHHNVYSLSSSIPQLEYAPLVNQQPEFSQPDSGLIVPVFQRGDDPIDAINHVMSFLTVVVTFRYPTTINQLRNSSNPRQQATINDGKTVITHNAAYQADDLDAYDSDCDELNTAKVALMANLSHYGSDALAKVHNPNNVDNNMINQAVQVMPSFEKSNVMNCLETEITSDSNIIPYSHAIVIPDSEETLMLAEESRSKMLLKQKDHMMLEKKVNTTPVDYVVLNQLSQDFETQFVPQTELSAEQAFWSQNSMNSPEPSLSCRPTKVEVPKELPKVSMVNMSLKKLKHHLAGFDVVVKKNNHLATAHEGGVGHSKLNANFELKCVKCNGCMLSDNHDLCVLDFINNMNARVKSKSVKKSSKRKVGNQQERITTTTEVPLRKPTAPENEKPKPVEPCQSWGYIVSDVPSSSLDECKVVPKFKFGNDHVVKILGYGDYQIGNVTISRVYYVEGLGHNLYSVRQFYDTNLEVVFYQHTCFIRNLEGVDLLTGSRGNNLYTLSLGDMMASSPIWFLSKTSKTKSWLWHRCSILQNSKSIFLSKEDLKGTRIEHGFKRAFMSLFGQDVDTFTSTMLLNVDQLQKQLDKDEFQEDGSMAAFWVVNNQFQKFIDSQFTLDYDSQMTDKYFVEYTGIEVKHFRDTLLQHMGNVKKSVAERTRHQRQYDRRVNKRQMQTQESKIDTGKAVDDDLVVTESSGTESEVQDDNSRSGNDTDADDADIRPIYDEEPMAEYPEQCQVKSPMLDSSPDNQTTEYSKNSLESENILLKKIVA